MGVRRKEADSWFLTLLTEWIVVPFMKLDNKRKDKFGRTDSDFSLIH